MKLYISARVSHSQILKINVGFFYTLKLVTPYAGLPTLTNFFVFLRISSHFTAVRPDKQKYDQRRHPQWFIVKAASSSIKPVTRNRTPTIITPVNWQSESTSCLSSFPQNMTSKCFIILHNIENTCLPLIRSIFWESITINNLYLYEDLPNTTTCHFPRWRILLLMLHVS